ncbi:hypothetical protein TNCT_712491 [Trichonephila clavata]|uniref:Uncharacterized protein n=1 Tax=Trichonephila clavata TaxID=2740835 RepID=A0A8X6J263_TRICU|nr:hypothetical protein TNCT_712491 [Trichonephila clavata]
MPRGRCHIAVSARFVSTSVMSYRKKRFQSFVFFMKRSNSKRKSAALEENETEAIEKQAQRKTEATVADEQMEKRTATAAVWEALLLVDVIVCAQKLMLQWVEGRLTLLSAQDSLWLNSDHNLRGR